ncbi:MAG: hypothetical protein OXF46_00250 [Rhodobacteraceae bacterium]|nr:hypothetical protein [Paracoccaceae bacterium]
MYVFHIAVSFAMNSPNLVFSLFFGLIRSSSHSILFVFRPHVAKRAGSWLFRVRNANWAMLNLKECDKNRLHHGY